MILKITLNLTKIVKNVKSKRLLIKKKIKRTLRMKDTSCKLNKQSI